MTVPDINDELGRYRTRIAAYLDAHFRRRAADLAEINAWGAGFERRMRPFVAGGKMIRGGLVLAAHDRLGGRRSPDAMKTAAALELFHSAFLVHDDIMDDDPLRRGRPSIHVQYRREAEKRNLPGAAGFGRAAALCAGDVLIFMGLEILASMSAPAAVKSRLLALLGRELAHVGPAQIQDVYAGRTRRPLSRSDILRLYTYKTARYTYSLPLQAGAILAGAGPAALRALEAVGRDLGLVFQIKDDELGQFGDAATTGKPIGSDIGEGKKTLYHLYLTRALGPKAAAVYGRKRRPGRREITRLNALLRKEKIPERVAQDLRRLARRCEDGIRTAALPAGLKEALRGLLAASLARTS